MEMHERPSLGEYAARARGAEGWECPRCGCTDWRVANSYFVPSSDSRNRTRFCRHCKQVIYTREVLVDSVDEQTTTNSNGL